MNQWSKKDETDQTGLDQRRRWGSRATYLFLLFPWKVTELCYVTSKSVWRPNSRTLGSIAGSDTERQETPLFLPLTVRASQRALPAVTRTVCQFWGVGPSRERSWCAGRRHAVLQAGVRERVREHRGGAPRRGRCWPNSCPTADS